MKTIKPILLLLAIAATAVSAAAQGVALDIDLRKPGAPVQSTMYGIFFEDINHAADGGLYAELVKNRSFEFPQALQGWKSFGCVEVRDDGPFGRCPHYVRLFDPGHPAKQTGLENEGFIGIGVEKGKSYDFSVWARVPDGGEASVAVELVSPASMSSSQTIARDTLAFKGADWARYTLKLTPSETDSKAVLRIYLDGSRTSVDLEHVSLMPDDAVEGVYRRDLEQALADLHPGIFRFPGGCIVEGTEEWDRYQWKNTVGIPENRPLNLNRWQYTFTSRFYPDYYQSYGLGFYEYFRLSEIIGAEPLPILNCGLVCQFQNDDDSDQIPEDRLEPYIQDVLDLIEFANGPVESTWGALRAEMGHPEPFGLKYVGIGNEQWGKIYPERLKPFVEAVRKACPEIKIVGSAGPYPEGEEFEYLWPEMARLGADLVDEHYYRSAEWFLSQGTRYDSYDRKGPKVFAGEYACHDSGWRWNQFHAALAEAALMTGLERNADIVHMATYAPLFAHVEGWQWRPDLIWFDNLRSMRTTSWHVQELYGRFKGQNVLTLLEAGRPVAGLEGQNGIFASAVKDGDKVYVKVVNTSDQAQDVTMSFNGLRRHATVKADGRIDLKSDDLHGENTLDEPEKIAPAEAEFCGEGPVFKAPMAASSFTIFIFVTEK